MEWFKSDRAPTDREITMLNLFRKKPTPPTPDQKEKLLFWISEFFEHAAKVEVIMNEMNPKMQNPSLSYKQHNEEWEKSCAAELIEHYSQNECLRNAQIAWPSGKAIIDDLIAATSYTIKIANNAREIARYNLGNHSPEELRAKNRALLQENREHGKKGDKLMLTGVERLLEFVPEINSYLK